MSRYVPVVARTRKVPTWKMTPVELAKVWAEHYGYLRCGNWISRPDMVAVAGGYEELAVKLTAKGFIKEGVGIDWRRSYLRGARLERATRPAQARR